MWLAEDRVYVAPKRGIWKILVKINIFTIIVSCLFYLLVCKWEWLNSKLYDTLASFLPILLCIMIILVLCIFWFRIRAPKFDKWLADIANKRLSCETIYYSGKNLYIEYDVGLNKKDVKEFIEEISDKSNYFTYYLNKINIDKHQVSIQVNKKEEIPKRCAIDKEKDVKWNIIPMGESVNRERKTIAPIGWWLNDNLKDEEMTGTLPSTSLVIAGGTGSGKSVVENGIIGHITRFPDDIQGLLADVKQVEFGGLTDYRGIHKVALTVKETAELLEQARKIMQERFAFMKDHGVNNVYKLEAEVDWFEVAGKRFQFDEIFECTINGELKLLTLDQIYEEVEKGSDVEIDDKYING